MKLPNRSTEIADDAVVISGLAGRFPNSDNVAEFEKNLLNKVDCTTTEHGRWDIDDSKVPQRLGVCNNIDKFDRVFFGIHNKLTNIMEPTSRLLLEHCFEAVADAGINPRSLRGKNVAVYTATNLSESEKNIFAHKAQAAGFGIMGCSKAMIANRLSFFLGLTGSSMHMDGGCVGATSALEKAYFDLKSGECDGAIVAGGIINLHPHVSYQLKLLGLLSTDGKTRSFDDSGDGYTRSDGITVMYLQRAEDARRIYAEVVNARTLHTDCHNVQSIMYPTIEPQVKLMEQLLSESGLSPDDISFLEASGTGLRDIDAEELEAIDRVYNKRKEPLLVGSVLSNIGNAIPVNTLNSIIKLIVASETGQIPPNLNYENANSKAKCLKSGRVRIATELTPWTGKYASVNTSCYSGLFGNILLKLPNIEKKNNGVPDDNLLRLVIVSGRTEESVISLLNFMENKPIDVELLQMFYDIFDSGIDGHLYRGYTILPAKGLVAPEAKKQEFAFDSGVKREIWWIFSGMGSQWSGMGKALLKLSVFNDAIRKCDSVLKPRGYDIYKIITDDDPKMFDEIVNSFVGIAAVQIGLVDVLRSVGLEPDYIIGHSVGELGCAYADGCFTAEQMILAALSRGLASKEAKLIPGSMAAVGLGYDDIKPLCPPDIDIACHNGPDSTTISGPAESMKAFVASLTAKGIFARIVPSSNIAYHSRYISPAGPKLLQYLQQVIPNPNPRSDKWVSTSVPRSEWKTVKARLCSAEYHTNNLLSPVLFDETSRLIPANAVCVEIAPHGLLQAILKKSLPSTCINIPLTRRGYSDNFELLLAGLGKLHNVGLHPKIPNLYPKVQYPVGKGTPSISSLIKWDHTTKWRIDYYTPLEDVKKGAKTFEIGLNIDDDKYLKGCVLNGKVVTPLSFYLVKVWDIFKNLYATEMLDIIFENIKVHELVTHVPDGEIIEISVMIFKGTGRFEVIEARTLIVSGTIKSTSAPSQERINKYKSKYLDQDKYEISREDFYTEMRMRGYDYSGEFKNVLKSSFKRSSGLIKLSDSWVTFIDSVLQLYTFGSDTRQVEVPWSIRKIVIDNQQQETAIENSEDIQVITDKKLDYISAGGLEIQGLRTSTLPKYVEQSRFSNDTLNVLHNVDKSNLSLAANLRLILQIVLENTFSKKIQKIQFIDNDKCEKIRAFNTAMYAIPEASLFKYEVSPYEKVTFNKALTVLTDDLDNYDLKEISQKLKKYKFLLITFTNSKEDSYIKLAESLGLKIVLIRKTGNDILVLLRKKCSFTNIQIINVCQNKEKTLDIIKNMKESLASERILFIIKSKDVNVSEFINQLEQMFNLDKIRIFIVQGLNVPEDPFSDLLYKNQLESDLFMNILTPKKVWATLRRTTVTLNARLCQTWAANQTHLHDPLSITWTQGTPTENIENKIRVEYSALNSQDILIANGSFYADPDEISGKNRIAQTSLGFEFSGTDFKGNRVMGITYGNSLSNFVNADAGWAWTIPKSWSFEDAVTVPFSYILAYWTILVKAEVRAEDKVLLSNCCDGVGLASLHLAIQTKCDLFVTYETENEKNLIKTTFPQLPDNRLLKLSRNSFRDEILLHTKGQGIDVIICNQSEVKNMEVFFNTTQRNARIILINDLSDNNIHEHIGTRIFLKEITFSSVVPRRVLLSDSDTKKMLINMLQDGINAGYVKPLPRTVYPRASLTKAFSSCISKKNIGKIVVKVTQEDVRKNEALAIPRLHCFGKKCYLIIEGLTTCGLELIDWLITRGARTFVIASTLKVENSYKNLRLSLWQSYGVKIILRENLDLSQPQNIKALFKEASSLAPIDAVFDLRRTDLACRKNTFSNDALDLTTRTADEESRVTCPELRLFVVCSTTANAGSLITVKKSEQYSINSSEQRIVEEIIERRKKDGLPGLLIRWGLVDAAHEYKNTPDMNVILPAVSKYILKLDELLGMEENVVEVSYFTSVTNEIEEDIVEIEAYELHLKTNQAKLFSESLYVDEGECMRCLNI